MTTTFRLADIDPNTIQVVYQPVEKYYTLSASVTGNKRLIKRTVSNAASFEATANYVAALDITLENKMTTRQVAIALKRAVILCGGKASKGEFFSARKPGVRASQTKPASTNRCSVAVRQRKQFFETNITVSVKAALAALRFKLCPEGYTHFNAQPPLFITWAYKESAVEPHTPYTSRAMRHNLSNIIAACIVAVGLVSSARIIAGRSAPPPEAIPVQAAAPAVPVSSARPLAPPPLSQETIEQQVREQVLAAPELQTYRYNNVVYRLSDATVSGVSYSAETDNFGAAVKLVWQPSTAPEQLQQSYLTLNNNGYNQYAGSVILNPGAFAKLKSATICVK